MTIPIQLLGTLVQPLFFHSFCSSIVDIALLKLDQVEDKIEIILSPPKFKISVQESFKVNSFLVLTRNLSKLLPS